MSEAVAERRAGLDGLRGIAALGVALHHVFFYLAPWPYAAGPLAGWITLWGWTLVDLFFVLSGYVFAHVYLPGKSLNTAAGRADFAVARFARLYPLHLAALVTFLVIHPQNPQNTLAAFAASAAMLQAALPNPTGVYNFAAWSLSVEVLCYGLFALAAAGGRRVLLAATAIILLVNTLLLALAGSPGDAAVQDLIRRGLLGFFCGQALWHGRARLETLPSALLLAGLGAGLWLQLSGRIMPVLPLTLLAWPCALLLALRCRWMEARPLVWLGDRSYAIYLLHMVVIVVVVVDLRIAATALPAPLRAGLELVVVAAILGLADLSYRWLERPARRWIRQTWAGRSRGRELGAVTGGTN